MPGELSYSNPPLMVPCNHIAIANPRLIQIIIQFYSILTFLCTVRVTLLPLCLTLSLPKRLSKYKAYLYTDNLFESNRVN